MVDRTVIARLRRLCEEEPRAAMPRTLRVPTFHDELVARATEINALRRGLREAVAIIESLDARSDSAA